MKIVLLSGGCGVGKRSIGESLSKKIGFPLIHNHLTTNIARVIHGECNKSNALAFNSLLFTLRKEIILGALSNNQVGLVMTHASHERVGHDYYLFLRGLCNFYGIEFFVINLFCNEDERFVRFLQTDRRGFGKPCDLKTFDKIKS